MSRENKVGMLISVAFLCLIGGVVYVKLQERDYLTAAPGLPSEKDWADMMNPKPGSPEAELAKRAVPVGKVDPKSFVPPKPMPPMDEGAIRLVQGPGGSPLNMPAPPPPAADEKPKLPATDEKPEPPASETNAAPANPTPPPAETSDTPSKPGEVRTTTPPVSEPSLTPEPAIETTSPPFAGVPTSSSPLERVGTSTQLTEDKPKPEAGDVVVPAPSSPAVPASPESSPAPTPPASPAETGSVSVPAPAPAVDRNPDRRVAPAPAVKGSSTITDVKEAPPAPPPTAADAKPTTTSPPEVVLGAPVPAKTKPNTLNPGVMPGRPSPVVPLADDLPDPPGGSPISGGSSTRNPIRRPPPIGAPPALASPPIMAPAPAAPPRIRPVQTAQRPVVESFDEETYAIGPGDTLERISQKFYHSDKYARALLLFNRSHPLCSDALRNDPPSLQPGQPFFVPPIRILEKRYAVTIPNLGPATPSTGVAPASTTPPPVSAGRPRQYQVRGNNETFWDIARRTLGNGERWGDIHRLNRQFDPKRPVPPGTVLQIPDR